MDARAARAANKALEEYTSSSSCGRLCAHYLSDSAKSSLSVSSPHRVHPIAVSLNPTLSVLSYFRLTQKDTKSTHSFIT